MKYGIWNIAQPDMSGVNALAGAGYAPLTAMVLAARGICDPDRAKHYLDCNCPLPDPFLLTDMDNAVSRIRLALSANEKIAVFGDYDVDGITATCLLTDFLRYQGADCVSYIPGRLEEGYGLNPMALHQLHEEGVTLVITVDCGITATEEALLCRELGIDLIITDHHECKDVLPQALAVVDPHRPDGGYPHTNLSGVAVAFKLASALCGSQEEVLAEYADMVCLGTVADVIPLLGENRVFVSRGLESLNHTTRPGLAALIEQCGCQGSVCSTSIGFMLAPRINAAGRMGQISLAVDLFLTQDPERARQVVTALCDLNRQRQEVESQIYAGAVAMLPEGATPEAIVLADESWHQGVVGIVASRIAEEYACPTFLICLDGDHGKASSRSHGGFNLFGALTTLSPLLESYGGHELAAGFTIQRQNIPEFRREMCRLAGEYFSGSVPTAKLDIDCAVTADLLTIPGIESLSALEPCGSCCPKPVLMLKNVILERISMVGGGKHMRLQLRCGHQRLAGIFFSATPESASVAQGDLVDVAFHPQINEYRGERSVQLNLVDIRPACTADCPVEISAYRALSENRLTAALAAQLLPERSMLAMVWRYLAQTPEELRESPICLCRKMVRWSGMPMSLEQMLVCLDIFRDVGLIRLQRLHRYLHIFRAPVSGKADLNKSQTMQQLLRGKES